MNEQGGKIIGNKTKPFAYTFRANEKEKRLIDRAIAISGLTMREFIIRVITNKSIIVVDCGGEILAELKRQGNNLNQAVRNYYYDNDTRAELNSCVAKLKELYKSLIAVIEGLNNAAFEMQCK